MNIFPNQKLFWFLKPTASAVNSIFTEKVAVTFFKR